MYMYQQILRFFLDFSAVLLERSIFCFERMLRYNLSTTFKILNTVIIIKHFIGHFSGFSLIKSAFGVTHKAPAKAKRDRQAVRWIDRQMMDTVIPLIQWHRQGPIYLYV